MLSRFGLGILPPRTRGEGGSCRILPTLPSFVASPGSVLHLARVFLGATPQRFWLELAPGSVQVLGSSVAGHVTRVGVVRAGSAQD